MPFFTVFFAAFLRFLAIGVTPFLDEILHNDWTLSKGFSSANAILPRLDGPMTSRRRVLRSIPSTTARRIRAVITRAMGSSRDGASSARETIRQRAWSGSLRGRFRGRAAADGNRAGGFVGPAAGPAAVHKTCKFSGKLWVFRHPATPVALRSGSSLRAEAAWSSADWRARAAPPAEFHSAQRTIIQRRFCWSGSQRRGYRSRGVRTHAVVDGAGLRTARKSAQKIL